MLRLLRSAICFLSLLLLHSAALAEKRVALVIGNQGYASDVGPLKNPHNDIRIVGTALAKVGFEVIAPVRDASRDQILLRCTILPTGCGRQGLMRSAFSTTPGMAWRSGATTF